MSVKDKSISGLVIIDKPKGITSHDVVVRVRKLSGQRKAGHTGTLDPLATGVLIVCLGQATRLIEYVMAGRKQYRATIRFGLTTDTLDAEGKIIAQQDTSALTETRLRDILPKFQGGIEQIPPIFSALKKDGQPLYKRARSGQPVEVEARLVTIHTLTWVAWQSPDLTLDVTCSPGTYIRSLARDIGEAVGTGAHLAELIRTANGPWSLEQAVSLAQLEQAAQAGGPGWQKYLYPSDEAVAHLSKIVLTEADVAHVKHGRQIQLASVEIPVSPICDETPPDLARAYTPDGKLLAILKLIDIDGNIWQPKKVFQI